MSSSTGNTGARLADETEDTAGKLLDSQGRAINRATESAGGTLSEIETFVREQPFSAAFIALGIGYIIGRLRLL